jgi:RNA polymerase sigma factor (sigma-70 family)
MLRSPARPVPFRIDWARHVGSPFASIERLAGRLPFRIDDSSAVNNIFARYKQTGGEREEELLEIWTYCFVWRYFLWKHIQNEAGSPGDFEAVVTETYRRVSVGRDQLTSSSRYASWVSVVCRNTFLNYARKLGTEVYLDERGTELLESGVPTRQHDPALLRRAIEEAVHRLPRHLLDSARLYFIERLDYEEMAAVTGKTAATLRAYIHKSMVRLRSDPWLKEFREYMNDEFFDE